MLTKATSPMINPSNKINNTYKNNSLKTNNRYDQKRLEATPRATSLSDPDTGKQGRKLKKNITP